MVSKILSISNTLIPIKLTIDSSLGSILFTNLLWSNIISSQNCRLFLGFHTSLQFSHSCWENGMALGLPHQRFWLTEWFPRLIILLILFGSLKKNYLSWLIHQSTDLINRWQHIAALTAKTHDWEPVGFQIFWLFLV